MGSWQDMKRDEHRAAMEMYAAEAIFRDEVAEGLRCSLFQPNTEASPRLLTCPARCRRWSRRCGSLCKATRLRRRPTLMPLRLPSPKTSATDAYEHALQLRASPPLSHQCHSRCLRSLHVQRGLSVMRCALSQSDVNFFGFGVVRRPKQAYRNLLLLNSHCLQSSGQLLEAE